MAGLLMPRINRAHEKRTKPAIPTMPALLMFWTNIAGRPSTRKVEPTRTSRKAGTQNELAISCPLLILRSAPTAAIKLPRSRATPLKRYKVADPMVKNLLTGQMDFYKETDPF